MYSDFQICYIPLLILSVSQGLSDYRLRNVDNDNSKVTGNFPFDYYIWVTTVP